MQNQLMGGFNAELNISRNPYFKPDDLNEFEHFNYMAIALLHLSGVRLPSQAQIDKVEYEIKKLFKKL